MPQLRLIVNSIGEKAVFIVPTKPMGEVIPSTTPPSRRPISTGRANLVCDALNTDQVDLNAPVEEQMAKFPNFKDPVAYEAQLGPGDGSLPPNLSISDLFQCSTFRLTGSTMLRPWSSVSL